VLEALSKQLALGSALSDEQVVFAVGQLIDEQISAETKADFLAALARKGETVAEIAAFARALRAKSLPPPLDARTRSGEILDVCGTGGDRLGTFNISTTVALVVAAADVTVAKHGNRARPPVRSGTITSLFFSRRTTIPPSSTLRRRANFAPNAANEPSSTSSARS